MSAQPLTYERFREEIAESRRNFDKMMADIAQQAAESDARFDKRMEESDKRREESDKRFREEMAESRREFDKQQAERQKELDRMWEKAAERVAENDKKISAIGLRVGDLVEHMIGGKNVVEQFQALGYNVTQHSRNVVFGQKGLTCIGQIDLLLYLTMPIVVLFLGFETSGSSEFRVRVCIRFRHGLDSH